MTHCSGKAISRAYAECAFVALGIHHAMRMRRITLPPVTCPAPRYFSTLSDNSNDLRKKII